MNSQLTDCILLYLTISITKYLPIVSNAASIIPTTVLCEFYNKTSCTDGNNSNCSGIQECGYPKNGKRNHCYVLWSKSENDTQLISIKVHLKGCFLDNEDCYNETKCIEKPGIARYSFYFCCCEGNMCNQHFTFNLKPTPTQTTTAVPNQSLGAHSNLQPVLMSTTFIALVFFISVVIIKFIFYCMPKLQLHFSNQELRPPLPLIDVKPFQLLELKARGRFGVVWKAQFKAQLVAVKIFPNRNKESWLVEQEIFKSPEMVHANILEFIGVGQYENNNLQDEFWLITAYHELGSLYDFLKGHTLSWNELYLISETMIRGLAHLHQSRSNDRKKPVIAHRDFKSTNVLLKHDLTACIADFGLALAFDTNKSCTVSQVEGTRRYMAPEVLEGAIDVRSECFLSIDMYACALVLWELVSRCSTTTQNFQEYRLPFEKEVGLHPSLETMQEFVVQKKRRPEILEHWRCHRGLGSVCEVIEECWDNDSEARLTAACVLERLISIKGVNL